MISPDGAQICVSDLTVLSDSSVDQKVMLSSYGVNSNSILGLTHVFTHVPAHLIHHDAR